MSAIWLKDSLFNLQFGYKLLSLWHLAMTMLVMGRGKRSWENRLEWAKEYVGGLFVAIPIF